VPKTRSLRLSWQVAPRVRLGETFTAELDDWRPVRSPRNGSVASRCREVGHHVGMTESSKRVIGSALAEYCQCRLVLDSLRCHCRSFMLPSCRRTLNIMIHRASAVELGARALSLRDLAHGARNNTPSPIQASRAASNRQPGLTRCQRTR